MFDESTLEVTCPGNKSCNLLLVNLAGWRGGGVGAVFKFHGLGTDLSPFQPHSRALSDSINMYALPRPLRVGTTLYDIPILYTR